MARSPIDPVGGLGAKLGPRLAQLLVQAQVATRSKLQDTEHKLRVHSAQTVFEGIGHEFGLLTRLTQDYLLRDQPLPPELDEILTRVASGREQWLAITGMVTGMSGAPSAISTILSNYMAPAVRSAVSASPNLVPDIGTLAGLAARGIIPEALAAQVGHGLGYATGWTENLILAARSVPDITTLLELLRRGRIDAVHLEAWARRSGLSDDAIGPILDLQRVHIAPADAALALLRGVIDETQARAIAAVNGVTAADLDILVANTGEPPPMIELLSLWRRGKIDTARLDRGIRQSRVRNEWIDAIHMLGVIPPSPAEALEALLEGQVDRPEALRRYVEGGGDPTWFEQSFNTHGQAPSPVQLQDMANRGIIPWGGTGPGAVSFAQGFLEGPWRNKWQSAFRKAAEYLPPPRTITALVRAHAIDHATALDLLVKQGLNHELAAAYIAGASQDKVKPHRDLAVGEIRTLYRDHALDEAQAKAMLVGLGYDDQEAAFIVQVVDLERARVYIESAIGRVRSRYIGHTLDKGGAQTALDALGLAASQRDWLLGVWTIEREATVRRLTQAQVIRAHKRGLIDDADATARLVAMGYPQTDAAILIALG